MSRCLCSGCGARFAGVAAFEVHRVGSFAHIGRKSSRRCLVTTAELGSAGLVQIAAKHSRRNPNGAVLWTLGNVEAPAQVQVVGQGAPAVAFATLWGQTEGLSA